MAVSWLDPVIGTLFEDVLTILRERDENVAKMNFDTDTDVPTDFIRSNTVNDDKLERYNGATYDPLAFHAVIDAHIADGAIHAIVEPGTIAMYGGATAPSGWAFCRGGAFSRTAVGNGLELFNNIGINYGSGDGFSTANYPDFRRRMPMGKADSGAVSNLGDSGGDFDHTHGLPDHDHTTPDHKHGLANHTHSIAAHQHSIGAHKHPVPAHYHNVQGNGADLRIDNGGDHRHIITVKVNSSGGSSRRTPNSGSGSVKDRYTDYETHAHPNNEFLGRVGHVNSGKSGDGAFNSEDNSAFNSDYNTGGLATGFPSPNLSDFISGGAASTGMAGSANPTDAANPPYLAVNFIIKL